MTGKNGRKMRRKAGGVAMLLMASSSLLTGCTTWVPLSRNDSQLVGPAPYANQTPMNSALLCLRPFTKDRDLRLGVADFVDGSGASMGNTDVNGHYFSQRPDLMMIVALNKAGVRLVNRTSTAVAEWEMRQAMDKRLGDGKSTVVGTTKYDYRPVRAGEFLGSNYYIHGAITEINWALANGVEEYGFLGADAGKTTYRVSMAIDLVVTNSATTEVVFARSYAKQLVGYQVQAGVFRFVDVSVGPTHTELFESNVGDKKNEPVQRALRWLIESAAYDTVAELEGRHQSCDALVPGLYADGPPDQLGVGGLIPFLGEKPGQPNADGPVKLEPETPPAPEAAHQAEKAKPADVPVSALVPSALVPSGLVPSGPRRTQVQEAKATVSKDKFAHAAKPVVVRPAVDVAAHQTAAATTVAAVAKPGAAASEPVGGMDILRLALRMVADMFDQGGAAHVGPSKEPAFDQRVMKSNTAAPAIQGEASNVSVADQPAATAGVRRDTFKPTTAEKKTTDSCDESQSYVRTAVGSKCMFGVDLNNSTVEGVRS